MEKPPQLVAFDDVLHTPIEKWESSLEAMDAFMYPISEKFMIAFPNMASYMSQKYIRGRDSARFWNSVCKDKYGYSIQGWQRHKKPTPTAKEKKDKTDILLDENIIYGYSKVYGYDFESVKLAIKAYPDEMREELKEYKVDYIDNAPSDSVKESED